MVDKPPHHGTELQNTFVISTFVIIFGHDLFVAAVIVLSLFSMPSDGNSFNQNSLPAWKVADIAYQSSVDRIISENLENSEEK
jgi:hypothetical protein